MTIFCPECKKELEDILSVLQQQDEEDYYCPKCDYCIPKEIIESVYQQWIMMKTIGVSLIIIDSIWLSQYEEDNLAVVVQIEFAKKLEKTVILAVDNRLDQRERKKIQQLFNKNKVIQTVYFDPIKLSQGDEPAVKQIVAAMDNLGPWVLSNKINVAPPIFQVNN